MVKYGFARKVTCALEATYAYMLRLLRVKQLMLEGLSCSLWRGDDSPTDLKCFFTLWWWLDWIFDDSLIVLIRCPGGSVPVMLSSIFLRRSWFTIGLSGFVVPEDLSQWFDVLYFCEDIDFPLGRPDSLSRKICPSDSMLRLFARILISDLVVLLIKRDSAYCSATIRSSDVLLCVRLQTTTVSF